MCFIKYLSRDFAIVIYYSSQLIWIAEFIKHTIYITFTVKKKTIMILIYIVWRALVEIFIFIYTKQIKFWFYMYKSRFRGNIGMKVNYECLFEYNFQVITSDIA